MKSASGISAHGGLELSQDGTGGSQKHPVVSLCSKPLDWLYNFTHPSLRSSPFCAGKAENPSLAPRERDSRHWLKSSVLQRDDSVEAAGQFEIMGGDQGGEALRTDDLDQRIHDARRGGVVEIAGRLVGQQDVGVVRQRADDRDTLLFAAGEARRTARPARRSRRR